MKRNMVVVIQTVLPDYRLPFFKMLKSKLGENFIMFSGNEDFSTVKNRCTEERFVSTITNRFYLSKAILWQGINWKISLSSDVVILNGNFRILSSLLLVFLRWILNKKTLNWNHIEGRRNILSSVRKAHFNMFTGIICYTESEAEKLRRLGFKKRVWVAPNSCVAQIDCHPVKDGNYFEPLGVLFVGRLVSAKKPLLLMQGFHRALVTVDAPNIGKLIFVGEGPDEGKLRQYLNAHKELKGMVEFAGHTNDISSLKSLYSKSLVSVSPGYVGLSAMQSFAFGVPMLVARDEPHSPEISACEVGKNCIFFESNDANDLASTILSAYRMQEYWLSQGWKISQNIAKNYSYESMVEGYYRAITEVLN